MGWSLPPGKMWSGAPDWAIVDDPNYPYASAQGTQSSPAVQPMPPALDFSWDDSNSNSYSGGQGKADLSGIKPGQSYSQQPDQSFASQDYSNYGYGGSQQGDNMGEDGSGDYGGYSGALPDTGGGVMDVGNNTIIGSGQGDYSGGGGGFNYAAYDPNGGSYAPPPNGMSYTDQVYAPYQAETAAFFNQPNSFNGGPTQQPGSSGKMNAGGFGSQPTGGGTQSSANNYNRIALGTPDKTMYNAYTANTLQGPDQTLYNKYSQLLQNPSTFAQDPAYQFLFNQGTQALNRTMAAKKMAISGNAGLDAINYGQGAANQYVGQRLGQLNAGAGMEMNRYLGQNQALGGASSQELARFMGPAGLLPSYSGANNNVVNMQGSQDAANALLPYYQQMLSQASQPMSYGGGAYMPNPGLMPSGGASYNGLTPGNQGYQQTLNPQMIQQLLAANSGGDQYAGGAADWNNFQDTLYGP